MDFVDAFDISASGLAAERFRLETIAGNLANQRTTRTPEGGPYQRHVPVFAANPVRHDGVSNPSLAAVRIVGVSVVPGYESVYEPGHPDADIDGYVKYPQIDVLHEMVDLMTTSRSYEANATVVETTRDLAMRALEIGR